MGRGLLIINMSDTNGRETIKVKLEYIQNDLKDVKTDVRDVRSILQHEYVTKEYFDIKLVPLEQKVNRLDKITWLVISTLIVGIMTGGLTMILR